MAFDIAAFENVIFKPRTAEVAVKTLAPFFDKGEDPIFIIKSLTHQELAYAETKSEQRKDLPGLVAAIAGRDSGEVVKAINKIYGTETANSAQSVMMMEIVTLGIDTPKLDGKQVRKLSKASPIEFKILFREIMTLTGLGHINASEKHQLSGQDQT